MSDDSTVDLENGHYSDSDSTPPSTSTDIEDEPEAGRAGEFDTTLPTTHKYLGKLDNVGGYTLYDEGQVIPAMLGIHTNTLVFPGFTLPLVIREYEGDRIVDDIKKNYTFALISTDETSTKLCEYGVIMEVFEISIRRGSITLKAKGRQRCLIVATEEVRPSWSRVRKVTVKVLPEPCATSPIGNTQLQTLRLRRATFRKDHPSLLRNYRHRRFHLSQYPFASWVYDRNEVSYYVHYLAEGLARYFKSRLPEDPHTLSYWFVQNFQLTHNERLAILKCGSVLERLRLELGFLKMMRAMTCRKCGIEIALQRDIFAMSIDGIQSNYCNPGGNVYETVTVLDATNYSLVGESSRQFTWFPGYAWTMMQCGCCRNHLGWQFTSKVHSPRKFFGLAHSYLEIKIVESGWEEGTSGERDLSLRYPFDCV